MSVSSRPWRLPILWPPQPEELMSSWLMRLARSNAMRAQELGYLISGRRKQLVWQDLDVLNGESDLESLVQLLCRPINDLACVLLVEDLKRLTCAPLKSERYYRWLLPRSDRVGRPTRRWIQFCPQCLAEDTKPYFRRHWRLSFVSICTQHNRTLRDSCVACGAIFNFQLIDRARPALTSDLPLSICPECGHDARNDDRCSVQSVSRRLIRFQEKLELAWRRGWTETPGGDARGWLYSAQYFDVLHRVMAQLNLSHRMVSATSLL